LPASSAAVLRGVTTSSGQPHAEQADDREGHGAPRRAQPGQADGGGDQDEGTAIAK
jgi:hypothetical protein